MVNILSNADHNESPKQGLPVQAILHLQKFPSICRVKYYLFLLLITLEPKYLAKLKMRNTKVVEGFVKQLCYCHLLSARCIRLFQRFRNVSVSYQQLLKNS